MKTKIIISAILWSILLLAANKKLNAQATLAGGLGPANIFGGFEFLGYTNPGNLDFQTQGVVNMMIDGTLGTGFAGLGNVGAPFIPQNLFHMDLNGNVDIFHQFTNGVTLNTATDGFLIGVDQNGRAQLNQQENLSIDFFTNAGENNSRKMRINHSAANIARVGIGVLTNPQTHLHLGLDVLGGSGFRNWMDIGVLMYGAPVGGIPTTGTDNMYVGLRTVAAGQTEAIIDYGNNPTGTVGPDRMRFIFTGAPGNGTSSGFDGLEFSRMVTTDGTNPRIGFGDMFTPAVDPQNTVEIRSSATSPQLAGLRFTNLTNILPPIVNPDPQNGVLSVDNNGDVIWVFDGGGGTLTSSCPTSWYLPKIDNPNTNNMVCSQAYDDGSTVTIGSYPPNSLNYKFEVTGTSAFSLQPNAPGAGPYTYYSSNQYPLIVKTSPDNGGNLGGLAILSAASNPTPQDALHLWADGIGTTYFTTIANRVLFQDRIIGTGGVNPFNTFLAFEPATGSVVIQDDYDSGSPVATTSGAKLYIEANDFPTNGFPNAPCLFANNIATNGGTAIIGNSTGDGSSCVGCNNIAGNFLANNNFNNFGIIARADDGALTNIPAVNIGGSFLALGAWNYNEGIYAQGLSPNPIGSGTNIGGRFNAEDARFNYAVHALVRNPSANNFGGSFRADNATNQNIGGKFEAYNGPGINYAVWAISNRNSCPNPCLPPCATPVCAQAAGYFQGQVYATNYYWPSDTMLKDNLVPLESLDTNITNSITAYSYKYDTTNYSSMNLPEGTHYGFSAEEVETKFPNMVKWFIKPAEYDTVGNITSPSVSYKAVSYVEFIPLLWNGFKNMQQQMDSMKQVMVSCCNIAPRNSNPNINTGNIELENVHTLQLFSADPNPFSESTWVRWNIPDEFQNAVIYFYDNAGAKINQYKIENKGSGELQVFGSKLSSGVYTYTLVVDGKMIDSKKMVKTK